MDVTVTMIHTLTEMKCCETLPECITFYLPAIQNILLVQTNELLRNRMKWKEHSATDVAYVLQN